MWLARQSATQRPSNVLIIDQDEAATSALSAQLAARGTNVFYTSAAHVGRRLSQEHYFDLVVVDSRIGAEVEPPLWETIARDGHRCVVLSVPDPCDRLPALALTVRGGLRRPLDANRVHLLAIEVAANASFDSYKHHLDVVR